MREIFDVLIRTAISIAVLLVMTRLDGAKQISQLSFFDYIVGITVGSVAGALAVDTDIAILPGIAVIVAYMLVSFIISIVTNKSIVLRRLLNGKPVFLIANGEILYKGLKRARFDISDLLRELRIQGYFDISQINFAILESSGALSVMPKGSARPATTGDMEIEVPEGAIAANVIMDGKILHGNLKAYGKSKEWLKMQLVRQNVEQKQVALATLSDNGQLTVCQKNFKNSSRTSLM